MSRIGKVMMVSAMCLLPSILSAGDWPQFGGGDSRNMTSPEKGLPDTISVVMKRVTDTSSGGAGQLVCDVPNSRNVKWSAKLGSKTFSSPVVSAGRLLIGSNGSGDGPNDRVDRSVTTCFDTSTGKRLWQLAVPRSPANRNLERGHMLGACSTPMIVGKRAYVMGYRCDVLCLDMDGQADGNDGPFKDEAQYCAAVGAPPVAITDADGDIVWRYDIEAELKLAPHDACASSPLVVGDLLYVATGNGVNQGHSVCDTPDAPSLIVLDAKTGQLVGKDDEKIGRRVFHGDWSSPSLGTVNGQAQLLFGGGDGLCYAFDPAPVKAPGEKVGILKKLWSFDANEGNKRGASEVLTTPVCHNNRVYVTIGQDWTHGRGRGVVHCIDATKTGDITQTGKIWSYYEIDRSVSGISIADGLVYVGDATGKLHCLDAETGKPFWVMDFKRGFWSASLVADGKVYIGDSEGVLHIMAAGKEMKTLCDAKMGGSSPIVSSPIAADGVLYVATWTHLFAVK